MFSWWGCFKLKAIEKILKEKIFDNIWIQPASGDAGGSLGAALALWYNEQGNARITNSNDDMKGSYLGPEFNQKEIEQELKNIGAVFEIFKYEEMIVKSLELYQGKVSWSVEWNLDHEP